MKKITINKSFDGGILFTLKTEKGLPLDMSLMLVYSRGFTPEWNCFIETGWAVHQIHDMAKAAFDESDREIKLLWPSVKHTFMLYASVFCEEYSHVFVGSEEQRLDVKNHIESVISDIRKSSEIMMSSLSNNYKNQKD